MKRMWFNITDETTTIFHLVEVLSFTCLFRSRLVQETHLHYSKVYARAGIAGRIARRRKGAKGQVIGREGDVIYPPPWVWGWVEL
jgi:hypothetical protein